MKKEINSKSRRKWIMGGLAAFASVALLTTGFAVWLVGVQKTKVNGDIKVNVDTAQNENIEFTAKLKDAQITLGEPNEVTGTASFVKANPSEKKEDFNISFESFVIKVGKAVAANYDCVKLSLIKDPTDDDGKTNGMNYVDNKAGSNEIGAVAIADGLTNKRATTDATYFELAHDTIDLKAPTAGDTNTEPVVDASTGITRTLKNSYYEYTITKEQAFNNFFKWGTFFGGVSPCTFYNAVFANKKDQTIENADKVQKEFDAMSTKYNAENTSICLHMELAKKGAK